MLICWFPGGKNILMTSQDIDIENGDERWNLLIICHADVGYFLNEVSTELECCYTYLKLLYLKDGVPDPSENRNHRWTPAMKKQKVDTEGAALGNLSEGYSATHIPKIL